MFLRSAFAVLSLLPTFAFAAGTLPNEEKYSFLEELSRNLDLTKSGVTLGMSSGGTSVYGVYTVGGKPQGAILPENAATKISGEIITFYIARAVGADSLYSPAIYHRLQGANLREFRKLIPSTPFKSKLKEQNRVALLARIAKSPTGIDTAYKHWGNKPADYDALVSVKANSLSSSHVIPGGRTAFAKLLKCDGPRPSSSTPLRMNGATNSELELARELSTIFLIDALSQQWDRFSGGNLQTITVDGTVHFAAYDNGGTWGGPKWTQKALANVSRFDRDVAEELLKMERFLSSGGEYHGYKTEAEFAAGLGVERFPNAMKNFKASLKLVAAHIRNNPGCHF